MRVGYFGSYARGDWGVGSDLDLLIILRDSDEPFEKRTLSLDNPRLPVPADTLVYTEAEWESLRTQPGFPATVDREIIWIDEEG